VKRSFQFTYDPNPVSSRLPQTIGRQERLDVTDANEIEGTG